MGVILALAALGIAVLAHRRAEPDRRSVLVSLGALAGGLVAQCTAWWALGDGGGFLLVVQAVAGLVTWFGLARLVAWGARRRDLVVRGVFALLTVLAVAGAGSAQLATFFTALGCFAFRWNRLFTTKQRFALAAGMLALFLLGLRVPAPKDAPGALEAALTFGRWSAGCAIVYAGFAALVLFRAFVRDPSLGIRTVGRRLALSHVLVVLVPLVLIGILWGFTTVLGVNNDRAMVAERTIAAEGRALVAVARVALGRGAADASLVRDRLAERGGAAREARVWRREGAAWTQIVGDSLRGAEVLREWPDSLGRFPEAAIVLFPESGRWYGATARDPGDASRAAVVLVRLDSLLAGEPSRIAAATLLVTARAASAETERDVDALRSAAENARSAQRARSARQRASTPAARESLSREDSLQLAKLRRTLGAFGVPESTIQLQQRRSRPSFTFQDNEGGKFEMKSLSPGGNPLLDGHAILPTIQPSARTGHLRLGRALLTSNVEPRVALAGLWRNIRENRASLLPVVLLGALTLLVLVVAVFDVGMVVGMGRSITAAIQGLKGGAARLEGGDLAHRIEVKGDDDLWDVADAFNQAMAGFERSRELEQERARLENELALARQIQSRLLPAGPPKIAGFEIAGHYDPARQVGGDYFDHLDLGNGRVLLVIADVSGKGVPAALLMSGFRASLMSQSADLAAGDPVALCGHLNDFLVRSVETGKFVTGFLAFADSRENVLHFVNAGHNPPVLLRHDGSTVSLEAGGLMFGVLPGAPYESASVPFTSGDLLVLYTDGVVEGASPAQELWGDDRLIETVKRCATRPSLEVVNTIAGEVRAFEGDAGPADDVTLLAARRL